MTQKPLNGKNSNNDDFLSRQKVTAEELANEAAKRQSQSQDDIDQESNIQQNLDNEPELQELLEYTPINKKGWRRFSSRVRQLIARILLRRQKHRQKHYNQEQAEAIKKTRDREREQEQHEYFNYRQKNKNKNQAARLRLNILRSLIHRKRQQIIRNIKQLKILRNFLLSQLRVMSWQQTTSPQKNPVSNRNIQQAVINNQRAIINNRKAQLSTLATTNLHRKNTQKTPENINSKIATNSNVPESKNPTARIKQTTHYAKITMSSMFDFKLVADLMFVAQGIVVKFAKNINEITKAQSEKKAIMQKKPEITINLTLKSYNKNEALGANKIWPDTHQNKAQDLKQTHDYNTTSQQPPETQQSFSVSAIKNKNNSGQISR